MDGNGRWAVERGKPRSFGHREGLSVAKKIVKAARRFGIRFVTLYVFSTENWKRAKEEVSFLMELIGRHLMREMEFYRANSIRVTHIGDPAGLPDSVREELDRVVADTAHFDDLTVNLAINYGGRDELVRGVRRWLSEKGESANQEEFTDRELSRCLDRPDIPDPDLIIRTAGERRLSNFLCWQSAYAELYYSDKLWPDWSEDDLAEAVECYLSRNRSYGGTK